MGIKIQRIIIFLMSFWGFTFLYTTNIETDTTKNRSLYMAQLKTCKQDEFEKKYEYPFLALLTEKRKKEYKKITDLEQKKEYIEFYWKELNPNPILNTNDYLHDFIRRYYFVKKNFSYSKPPYFDDRGKYYLKYGKPSYRYQEKSQIKNNKFFRNKNIRDHLTKELFQWSSAELSIPREYSVQSNETWVYNFKKGIKEKELIFHFVGDGHHFREVESLDDAITYPRKHELRFFYWCDMLKDRAAVIRSNSIFNVCEEIHRFEEDIRSVAGADGLGGSSIYDVGDPHHKLRQIRNRFKLDLKTKKALTPISLSAPRKALQELSFLYDIVQFKGAQNRTTLSINYFTPIIKNFTDYFTPPRPDTVSMEYACLFENHKLERIKKNTCSRSYSLKKISQLNFPYIIESSKISVSPLKGRITLQLKDQRTRRIGFVKRDISLRDFNTDKLNISDIQFSQILKDTMYSEFSPVISHSGISVIPYPYERIHNSDQLFCFFEIYNIKTSGIQSHYVISIKVTTANQKKGLFKKVFGVFSSSPETSISIEHTRDAIKDDSQELIGIDFGNLEAGHYTLSIGVTDQDNPGTSAIVKRDLQIVN